MLEILVIVVLSVVVLGWLFKSAIVYLAIREKDRAEEKERERIVNVMKKAEEDGLIPPKKRK